MSNSEITDGRTTFVATPATKVHGWDVCQTVDGGSTLVMKRSSIGKDVEAGNALRERMAVEGISPLLAQMDRSHRRQT